MENGDTFCAIKIFFFSVVNLRKCSSFFLPNLESIREFRIVNSPIPVCRSLVVTVKNLVPLFSKNSEFLPSNTSRKPHPSSLRPSFFAAETGTFQNYWGLSKQTVGKICFMYYSTTRLSSSIIHF